MYFVKYFMLLILYLYLEEYSNFSITDSHKSDEENIIRLFAKI